MAMLPMVLLISACGPRPCPSIEAEIVKERTAVQWPASPGVSPVDDLDKFLQKEFGLNRASATLTGAAVECFAQHHPARRSSGGASRAEYSDYAIAVTADISYQVVDIGKSTPVSGTVEFEAVSAAGVVLGETEAMVQLDRGLSNTRTSGRIILTEGEVQRVRKVRVGWRYGR